jgi:hypothetical protein
MVHDMRAFGHQRPTRDKDGNITGQKYSPVRVRTIDPLGGSFGSDKRRRLIVELAHGDTIRMKPEGTRRWISLEAKHVYQHALMGAANKVRMEKLSKRKAVVSAARERRRLDAQERRMREQAKTESAHA